MLGSERGNEAAILLSQPPKAAKELVTRITWDVSFRPFFSLQKQEHIIQVHCKKESGLYLSLPI